MVVFLFVFTVLRTAVNSDFVYSYMACFAKEVGALKISPPVRRGDTTWFLFGLISVVIGGTGAAFQVEDQMVVYLYFLVGMVYALGCTCLFIPEDTVCGTTAAHQVATLSGIFDSVVMFRMLLRPHLHSHSTQAADIVARIEGCEGSENARGEAQAGHVWGPPGYPTDPTGHPGGRDSRDRITDAGDGCNETSGTRSGRRIHTSENCLGKKHPKQDADGDPEQFGNQ